MDVITAIGAIGTMIGSVVVFLQLRTMIRQNAEDHERSRRENTVSYISQWVNNLDKKSSVARKLVEELNDREIKKLHNEEPFEIELDSALSNYIQILFSNNKLKKKKNKKSGVKFHISAENSSELRWLIMQYLNSLEATLLLWLHNIGDRKILESQFNYLFSHDKKHFLLKDFRIRAGGAKAFPAIEAFSLEMNRKHQEEVLSKIESKSKLGRLEGHSIA